MHDVGSDNESTLLLQVLDNLGIGGLDVLTNVFGDFGGEFARLVQRAGRNLVIPDDTVGNGDSVIVLSEGRSLVDDTGTGGRGDIGVGDDSESGLLVLLGEVVEHGDISPADHVFTLEGAHLLEWWFLLRVGLLLGVIALVDSRQELLEENEVLVAFVVVDFDVREVGVDTQT